jgi:polyphosphate kinase
MNAAHNQPEPVNTGATPGVTDAREAKRGVRTGTDAAAPPRTGMEKTEITNTEGGEYAFFDRDLSWLSFNDRVLLEAADPAVPVLERLNFLSIYSSNLDEFYRVRMPALVALQRLYEKHKVSEDSASLHADVAGRARALISGQQERFGRTLREILPRLQDSGIYVIYGAEVPEEIKPQLRHYFFTEVLAFLKPVRLADPEAKFFPENNKLYLAVTGAGTGEANQLVILNIPTEELPRFFKVEQDGKHFVVFLEDIVKMYLDVIPGIVATASYSFKVTRDAELNIDDEYEQDIAEKIEKQIGKRDFGLATRFLHEPGIPADLLEELVHKLDLEEAVIMQGGRYHNLRDLSGAAIKVPDLLYPKWPAITHFATESASLLEIIARQDLLLHTPYHSYDPVLRFFNEAAIRADVRHIYLTMYRVASDSRIINALLSAAHNGKKVTVLIELKARFDEENNLKWAKKLKKAGVQVLYTPVDLKVHAKLAIVRLKSGDMPKYLGLLATGNLNEGTARFYTDHILLTANQPMLKEAKEIFNSFQPKKLREPVFRKLLVAQHNMQDRFLELIDREINNVKLGFPSRITIKLNNLEERVLISKLYDASRAGVKIQLIVRSICCIIPGVAGLSENITVRRIVDRYLEHGRIYVFHNKGNREVYLGSADWMNRNIYKRIEVCFPILDQRLKEEVIDLLDLQLADTAKAVLIDENLEQFKLQREGFALRSQEAIYHKLQSGNEEKKMAGEENMRPDS